MKISPQFPFFSFSKEPIPFFAEPTLFDPPRCHVNCHQSYHRDHRCYRGDCKLFYPNEVICVFLEESRILHRGLEQRLRCPRCISHILCNLPLEPLFIDLFLACRSMALKAMQLVCSVSPTRTSSSRRGMDAVTPIRTIHQSLCQPKIICELQDDLFLP